MGRISGHLFHKAVAHPTSERLLNVYQATNWPTDRQLIGSIRITLQADH